MKRRDVLKRILASPAALVAAAPRLLRAAKKYAIGLDKAAKLKTVGGATVLKIADHKILFIRDSEETVRAINATCTHRKCVVEYKSSEKKVVCPCHGSKFDIQGRVLAGPAEKPLQTYESTLDGDRIVVSVE
jgi:cytochrome b6-f complex iron-sulfur subunit